MINICLGIETVCSRDFHGNMSSHQVFTWRFPKSPLPLSVLILNQTLTLFIFPHFPPVIFMPSSWTTGTISPYKSFPIFLQLYNIFLYIFTLYFNVYINPSWRRRRSRLLWVYFITHRFCPRTSRHLKMYRGTCLYK